MFARKFVKGIKVKVGDGEFPLDVAPRQAEVRSMGSGGGYRGGVSVIEIWFGFLKAFAFYSAIYVQTFV